MFFYQKLSLEVVLMGLLVLFILIAINEVTRRNKEAAIVSYIVLPLYVQFLYGLRKQ